MKNLFLIIILLSSTVIMGQTRVSNDQVTSGKNGLKYYNSKPFTGVVFVNHKNGKVWKEGAYVDGKMQGLSKGYYESGQIWFEQDVQNGQYIYIKKWHENGQIMSEQHYNKGKVNSFKEWDKEGNLLKEE